jgi:hypothetical protein
LSDMDIQKKSMKPELWQSRTFRFLRASGLT